MIISRRHSARQRALEAAHMWDMPAVVREYLETGDETKRVAASRAARDAAASRAVSATARDAAWVAANAAAWDIAWAIG